MFSGRPNPLYNIQIDSINNVTVRTPVNPSGALSPVTSPRQHSTTAPASDTAETNTADFEADLTNNVTVIPPASTSDRQHDTASPGSETADPQLGTSSPKSNAGEIQPETTLPGSETAGPGTTPPLSSTNQQTFTTSPQPDTEHSSSCSDFPPDIIVTDHHNLTQPRINTNFSSTSQETTRKGQGRDRGRGRHT